MVTATVGTPLQLPPPELISQLNNHFHSLCAVSISHGVVCGHAAACNPQAMIFAQMQNDLRSLIFNHVIILLPPHQAVILGERIYVPYRVLQYHITIEGFLKQRDSACNGNKLQRHRHHIRRTPNTEPESALLRGRRHIATLHISWRTVWKHVRIRGHVRGIVHTCSEVSSSMSSASEDCWLML